MGKGTIGRFEMVIVMPEHHQGIEYFRLNALNQVEDLRAGRNNIVEAALDALEPLRESSKDHIINMPEFKIDSNVDAETYLRAVTFWNFFMLRRITFL